MNWVTTVWPMMAALREVASAADTSALPGESKVAPAMVNAVRERNWRRTIGIAPGEVNIGFVFIVAGDRKHVARTATDCNAS